MPTPADAPDLREQLVDMIADFDRDPDGLTTRGTVAALLRAALGPDAPADPDLWESCECGVCEASECPCVGPVIPRAEVSAHHPEETR